MRYYGREIPVGRNEVACLDLTSLWILYIISLMFDKLSKLLGYDSLPRSCPVVREHRSQGIDRCQR
jgi:hypothetical protein